MCKPKLNLAIAKLSLATPFLGARVGADQNAASDLGTCRHQSLGDAIVGDGFLVSGCAPENSVFWLSVELSRR